MLLELKINPLITTLNFLWVLQCTCLSLYNQNLQVEIQNNHCCLWNIDAKPNKTLPTTYKVLLSQKLLENMLLTCIKKPWWSQKLDYLYNKKNYDHWTKWICMFVSSSNLSFIVFINVLSTILVQPNNSYENYANYNCFSTLSHFISPYYNL